MTDQEILAWEHALFDGLITLDEFLAGLRKQQVSTSRYLFVSIKDGFTFGCGVFLFLLLGSLGAGWMLGHFFR